MMLMIFIMISWRRYKDGIDVELIKREWLDEEANFCIDELYTEIYWTSLAYALWKIGHFG